MRRIITATCMFSLLFAPSFDSAAQQKGKPRDLYVAYQQHASAPVAHRPGRPGSRMQMELMRDNRRRFVTTRHTFLNGDRIAFRLGVNYEGYLTVTNIGTSGRVNLLYAGHVTPTSEMRIPEKGWIRVAGRSGDEVVNFILSSGPAQELEQISVPTQSGSPATTFSPETLVSNGEAQEILALLNSRAIKRGRDLLLEEDGDETYALATSFQAMETPIGFSITLKHR